MNPTGNKARSFFLAKYLNEHSDPDHLICANKLIQILNENGYTATRKTLLDDIDTLRNAGFQIIEHINGCVSYAIGNRTFTLSELRFLISAVSSSNFLTQENSEKLIKKLTTLASVNYSEKLSAYSFSAQTAKTQNNDSFKIMEIVGQAIESSKKILFRYFKYNENRTLVPRDTYIVSPYAVLWKDDRCYMLAYTEKRHIIQSFRIDRMGIPEITEETIVPKPENFNISDYTIGTVKMYGADNMTEVELLCGNELMNTLVDHFGADFPFCPAGSDCFKARITVGLGSTFYGWLFQYAGRIRLLSPASAVEEYKKLAEEVLKEEFQIGENVC